MSVDDVAERPVTSQPVVLLALGIVTGLHALPVVLCRMVPLLPTTQMSVAERGSTSWSEVVTPDVCCDQVARWKCEMLLLSPTAHTCELESPLIARNAIVVAMTCVLVQETPL